MIKTIVTFLAVTFASVGAAHAQSLYMVSIQDDGLTLVERDSIRWRDGHPQIKYHLVYRTPIGLERVYGEGFEWAQGMTATVEFDCKAPRWRDIGFNLFDFNQRPFGHLPPKEEWDSFEKDSDMEKMQALACRNELPTDTHLDSLAQAAFLFYDVVLNPEDE